MIDVWSAITSPYTDLIGVWFYAIVFFLVVAMIYLKSKNWGVTLTFTLIGGFIFVELFPGPVQKMGFVILSVGASMILFKFFVGR